jgi:hypothetical protein
VLLGADDHCFIGRVHEAFDSSTTSGDGSENTPFRR